MCKSVFLLLSAIRYVEMLLSVENVTFIEIRNDTVFPNCPYIWARDSFVTYVSIRKRTSPVKAKAANIFFAFIV